MNEVLLDSNIFLRHFLQDIQPQSELATSVITEIEDGKKTGFISILVINETIWILRKFYKIERSRLYSQLISLLQINNIKVIEVQKKILFRILETMKKRDIDFTDVYLYEIRGKREVVSFDQDFKKLKN